MECIETDVDAGTPTAMECDTSHPELDATVAEDYKEKGNESYRSGEYEEARQFYSQAIYHNPSVAGYYGNRSASLLMLGEYREALEDASRSVKLDEGFVKGYLRSAKCHLMLGNPHLSVQYYHKVLELQPGNTQAKEELKGAQTVDSHLSRAKLESEKKDHRSALYYLDRCLDSAPDCLHFKTMRAEALALCHRFDEAHTLCNEILRREKTNGDALYVKATCYYYQDSPDRANQFFQQALRVDPDHRKSRLAIKKSKQLLIKKDEGNSAFKEGHIERAHTLYSEALSIDPLNIHTNAKLYCNRALVGSKLGRLEEAIEDCCQAIELDPNYVRAYQRRAKLYQEAEKHDEAVRDLEKVQKLEPSMENRSSLQEGKRLQKLSKRKDYYKILGVARGATAEEIKKGYRKKAMAHHPDRHATAEPEVREAEERIFKEVGEAYQVLSDSRKKRRYDSGQDLEDLHGMGDMDASTLFSQMFGGFGGGFSRSGGGFGTQTFTFGGPGEYSFTF